MREYIWSPVRGTGRSAAEEEATVEPRLLAVMDE